MHSEHTIKQFIEARARCVPYTRIASTLKVPRDTLIALGQKYKNEIDDLRAVEAEAIRATYLGTRHQEVEVLAQRLQRLEAIFDQREPAFIPIQELTEMIKFTRDRLDKLCAKPEPVQPQTPENAAASSSEPRN